MLLITSDKITAGRPIADWIEVRCEWSVVITKRKTLKSILTNKYDGLYRPSSGGRQAVMFADDGSWRPSLRVPVPERNHPSWGRHDGSLHKTLCSWWVFTYNHVDVMLAAQGYIAPYDCHVISCSGLLPHGRGIDGARFAWRSIRDPGESLRWVPNETGTGTRAHSTSIGLRWSDTWWANPRANVTGSRCSDQNKEIISLVRRTSVTSKSTSPSQPSLVQ